jgi:hypothetical protein
VKARTQTYKFAMANVNNPPASGPDAPAYK